MLSGKSTHTKRKKHGTALQSPWPFSPKLTDLRALKVPSVLGSMHTTQALPVLIEWINLFDIELFGKSQQQPVFNAHLTFGRSP